RVHAEHLGAPGVRLQNIHEDLDSGGLARAVRTDETEDATLGNLELQAVEHGCAAAEALAEAERAENSAHSFLLPDFSVPSRRRQWSVMASITSSRSRP